jgi:hypothetical protein
MHSANRLISVTWLVAALFVSHSSAAPPSLKASASPTAIPTELKPPIQHLLAESATRVRDSKGDLGTIWLRKAVPAARTKNEPIYRDIPPTTLIGAVQFARPWIDFHHQEIPKGLYTMRIAVQPPSKDHEGTTPYRDLCILTPAGVDEKPETMPLKKLIELSTTATGGTHPVVMQLYPYAMPTKEPVVQMKSPKVVAVGIRGAIRSDGKDMDLGFSFTFVGRSGD